MSPNALALLANYVHSSYHLSFCNYFITIISKTVIVITFWVLQILHLNRMKDFTELFLYELKGTFYSILFIELPRDMCFPPCETIPFVSFIEFMTFTFIVVLHYKFDFKQKQKTDTKIFYAKYQIKVCIGT